MILHRATRLLAVILVLGLPACEKIATGPDPDSEEALTRLWRFTAVGDLERTIEFFDDGSFEMVVADFPARSCTAVEGTWSLATPGFITTRSTVRNGALVSEPAEDLPYFIDSDRLVITFPDRLGPEAHGQLSGTMPICADYGWMNMTMSAEIDGVLTDLSWEGGLFTVNLGASLTDGFLSITGYYDPDGVGLDPSCTACVLLNIDLFHELGAALTTGEYPVETFGPTGLRAEAQFTPSFSEPAQFGSNDSDPATQPWSGRVQVTTMNADVAEGTFEFVVYDATGSGPPYPSATITNGSFRLSFD